MIFISFRIYVLQHHRLGLLEQNLYRLSTAVCRRPIFLKPKIKARKLIVLSWHFLKLASVCRNWHRIFRLFSLHSTQSEGIFFKFLMIFRSTLSSPLLTVKIAVPILLFLLALAYNPYYALILKICQPSGKFLTDDIISFAIFSVNSFPLPHLFNSPPRTL